MCFYIDPNNSSSKIAETDISCYKVLIKQSHRGAGRYGSPFQPADWTLGVVKQDYLDQIPTGRYGGEINNGLHSFSSIKRAGVYTADKQLYNRKILKAVIPKGSEYYFNSDRKEYVSDRLIIKRESRRSLMFVIIGNLIENFTLQ